MYVVSACEFDSRDQPELRAVHAMARKCALVLVEFLVVVLILIVLAVGVPRIAGACAGTRNSSLETDLPEARSTTELYKPYHNDALPAEIGRIGGACPGRLGRVSMIQTQLSRERN